MPCDAKHSSAAFGVPSLWVFIQLFLHGSLWTFGQVDLNICMFEPGFGNCGCPFHIVIVPATKFLKLKNGVAVVTGGGVPVGDHAGGHSGS